MKKTWSVMKEIIPKMHQHNKSKLPRKLLVDEKYITLETEIAKKFNGFCTEIGPSLAKKIPTPCKPFEFFLKKTSTTLPERCLTINKLKDAFFSLKMNKSTGADKTSFNVIKNCFGELSDILRYDFDLSLQTEIFTDLLKIVKVTPAFKTDDLKEISNYRPISVLPCFSKILERIMHNRLYSYLVKEKILYSKQFGFQKGHSTEHAIAQLANQIHELFENDNYTLGVFIDLSEAFDAIDHAILFKKLESYGIKDIIVAWFRSYLTNRKRFIQITNDSKSDLRNTTCRVWQGSILGPLLFLVYVNDLPSSSKILNSIMFADDTNLFYEHKNIIKLFATVNEELMNINGWFMANKFSLNVGKTKYSLFHKPSRVDDLPIKLPKLSINNQKVKRASYTKFLGFFLDENLSWKEHLKYTENKI